MLTSVIEETQLAGVRLRSDHGSIGESRDSGDARELIRLVAHHGADREGRLLGARGVDREVVDGVEVLDDLDAGAVTPDHEIVTSIRGGAGRLKDHQSDE